MLNYRPKPPCLAIVFKHFIFKSRKHLDPGLVSVISILTLVEESFYVYRLNLYMHVVFLKKVHFPLLYLKLESELEFRIIYYNENWWVLFTKWAF